MSAMLGKELVVKVRNRMGVVFDVAKTVAEKGVNIHAILGTVQGDDCIVRLVTDDNLRAADALRAARYHPMEEPVIEIDMPDRPGMLESITHKLAEEHIELDHIYASMGAGSRSCRLILSSTDDAHAMVALNR